MWSLVFACLFLAFGRTAAGALALVGALLQFSSLQILRSSRSPSRAGNYLLLVSFPVVVTLTWHTGGFLSPVLLWLVLFPMAAIMVANDASGIVWGVISLVTVIGFFVAVETGIKTPPLLQAGETDVVWLMADVGLLLMVIFFTLVYEGFKDRTLERLRVANLQLASARDEAVEASRVQGDFLANMSHELRTPLNAVIGYSEMLAEEGQTLSAKEVERDLHKIRSAGKHLLQLVNSILDLSKLESGKMDVEVDEFPVASLVAELVSTMEQQVAKNENLVELICSPELGTIRSDSTKIRQCLYNLLSNSCKFTHKGKITVEVRPVDESVLFEVRDTGIGMSEDQLQKVFIPFVQADSSTARRYGGTGLGLTLSRRLCTLLGGQLEAESVVGQGSTFRLSIPKLYQAPVE